jgi:hypothetical protein
MWVNCNENAMINAATSPYVLIIRRLRTRAIISVPRERRSFAGRVRVVRSKATGPLLPGSSELLLKLFISMDDPASTLDLFF